MADNGDGVSEDGGRLDASARPDRAVFCEFPADFYTIFTDRVLYLGRPYAYTLSKSRGRRDVISVPVSGINRGMGWLACHGDADDETDGEALGLSGRKPRRSALLLRTVSGENVRRGALQRDPMGIDYSMQ